jgi:hypothetical protein
VNNLDSDSVMSQLSKVASDIYALKNAGLLNLELASVNAVLMLLSPVSQ